VIKIIKLFVSVSGTCRTVFELVKIACHVGDKSCTADRIEKRPLVAVITIGVFYERLISIAEYRHIGKFVFYRKLFVVYHVKDDFGVLFCDLEDVLDMFFSLQRSKAMNNIGKNDFSGFNISNYSGF
jgi:hypothetical protein